jgi:methionyl-tRNA synthetase
VTLIELMFLEGAEGKNYTCGLMQLATFHLPKNGLREKKRRTILKDQDTKLVHFIGKDNIIFHCVIFPAMLKAEGSYILP